MASFAVLGDIVLDCVGTSGELLGFEDATMLSKLVGPSLGGRGANFSLVLGHLGAFPVYLFAAVGKDFDGLQVGAPLLKNRVNTAKLYSNSDYDSAKCILMRDGKNARVYFYPGVLADEENILRAFLEGVKDLSVDVFYRTWGSPRVNLEIGQKTKARLNIFAPGTQTRSYSLDEIYDNLFVSNGVFVNENEGSRVLEKSGIGNFSLLARDYSLEFLVVTRGEGGSDIYTPKRRIPIAPFEVREVVNATGAGDTYAAGFLNRYLKTGSLEDAGIYASALSSFVVEGRAVTDLPPEGEVSERIRRL